MYQKTYGYINSEWGDLLTTYNGETLTYDENGHNAGLKLIENDAESTYYYQTNIQGDVIGILDENGVQVAAYSYDEWGKVFGVIGSNAEGIKTRHWCVKNFVKVEITRRRLNETRGENLKELIKETMDCDSSLFLTVGFIVQSFLPPAVFLGTLCGLREKNIVFEQK